MDEIRVTMERMNELDGFELCGRSRQPWIQADAEFLSDNVIGKKSGLWNRVIAGTDDILISSGEKLKTWNNT
jgi:hypothetical protein